MKERDNKGKKGVLEEERWNGLYKGEKGARVRERERAREREKRDL